MFTQVAAGWCPECFNSTQPPLTHTYTSMVCTGITYRFVVRTGRRGRRRKHLLDDLKKKKGYWKLKEEALDLTMWRTRFGRCYGPAQGRLQNECIKLDLQSRGKLMFEIITPFETKKEGMIYMVCCISRYIRHSFSWKYVPQKLPYVLTPEEKCNTTPTKLQSSFKFQLIRDTSRQQLG